MSARLCALLAALAEPAPRGHLIGAKGSSHPLPLATPFGQHGLLDFPSPILDEQVLRAAQSPRGPAGRMSQPERRTAADSLPGTFNEA